MCGRYVLVQDLGVLVAEFDAQLDPVLTERAYRAHYNVAPSVNIPIIINSSGVRLLTQVRWGILPAWSKTSSTLLINARGESVAEKITFKKAFATNRILIPATGYYEWMRPAKDPYFISPPADNPHPMAMAGLMSQSVIDGESRATCAIITLAAVPALAPIHDRMPASISHQNWDAWLDPEVDTLTARELMSARSDLQAIRVDLGVNSVRNNSPALIQEFIAAE